MLTRIYDTSLEIYIRTHATEYCQLFDSSWKLKDALSWMYDTYCIQEDYILEQRCSYHKIYKLKNPKNDGNY